MDPDNYSGIAIEAIQSFKWPVSIEVNCILSANSPSLGLIKEQIERMELDYINPLFLKDNKVKSQSYTPKIKIYSDTKKMEQFILNADLCIGSGGNSAWERCVLGLPTFLTSIAPNQKRNIQSISKSGAADIWKSKCDLLNLFNKYIENEEKLISLQKNAFNLCDGLGLFRITESIIRDI